MNVKRDLPVTTIGGYLGSGKTTLVNHLLRNAQGLRLAVLVNEFGDLPIDADLIEAQDDDIISIAGGCVCCSYGSDMTAALLDMAKLDPPPDHVLLEASGVAIPGAILGAVSLLQGFSTDGIVVLADAETVRQQAQHKYMGDTITRQLSDADIVLLNKSDLVSPDELEDTKQWIADQNPNTRIVTTSQSKAPPETVLESFLGRVYNTNRQHHEAGFDMVTLRPTGRLQADILAQRLASDEFGIVRAKGFVTSPEGQKTLIHVVGQRWQTADTDNGYDDGVVCIGLKDQLRTDELLALMQS